MLDEGNKNIVVFAADGTLIVSRVVSPDSPSDVIDSYMPQIISAFDVEGSPVREYATTPNLFRMRGVTPMGDLPTSSYTVDPRGRIYVTDGATYDIVAIDADGSKPWHLSVDLPPAPWAEEDTDNAMSHLRIPGAVSDFSWPRVLPSLVFLKVDGHGHLYVYRYMRSIYDQDHRIVDVFDRDGRHLFSGTHDAVPWSTRAATSSTPSRTTRTAADTSSSPTASSSRSDWLRNLAIGDRLTRVTPLQPHPLVG